MVHFDRACDLGVVRHMHKKPVGNRCFVQGGKLCRAKPRFLFHEMRLHQVAVRNERFGQRQADDAGGDMAFGVDQLIVGKNKLCGCFAEAMRARDQIVGGRIACGHFEASEVELLEV